MLPKYKYLSSSYFSKKRIAYYLFFSYIIPHADWDKFMTYTSCHNFNYKEVLDNMAIGVMLFCCELEARRIYLIPLIKEVLMKKDNIQNLENTNVSIGKNILYGSVALLAFGIVFAPKKTMCILDNFVKAMEKIEKISVGVRNTTENAKMAYDDVNYICHKQEYFQELEE